MEHPFLMFLDHTQRRSTVGTECGTWYDPDKVSFVSVVIQISHTQTGNHNLFHQWLYRPFTRHPNQ